MPEGYENIHLGMTREELRVARPNVTGLNLGLDPYVEHPSGALTESKPHMNESEVSEEMIMYGFNDTLLNSVSYVKQLASGAKFLQNQLKKNGRYDEIRMSSTSRYGMIKWIIQDEIYIYLSLPIDWSMSRNSWIGHQVMDTNVAQEFESEIAKALDKKGYDEVAFESFKARVAAFAEKTLSDREDNDADASLRRLRPWLGLLFLFCALTGILVFIFRESGAAAKKRKPCR